MPLIGEVLYLRAKSMKIFLSVLVLLIGVIIISCDKEGEVVPETPSTQQLPLKLESGPESISPIIETDLPASGEKGQEIIIMVSHVLSSGCAYYSSQKTVQEGTTFFVTFYEKSPLDVTCTTILRTAKAPYKFTPEKTGVYTLKFSNREEYLTQTITIH